MSLKTLLAITTLLLVTVLQCCKSVGPYRAESNSNSLTTVVAVDEPAILRRRNPSERYTPTRRLESSRAEHKLIENQAHLRVTASAASSSPTYDVHEVIINPTFGEIMHKALKAAFRGGTFASLASCMQVLSLMWLKTTVNYQYRYGGTLISALKQLYRQGGMARFYKGVTYALILGPLSKFGSTAANEAARTFIYSNFGRKDHSSGSEKLLLSSDAYIFASALGTFLSVFWRLMLLPLEICKTVLQVEGKPGFDSLMHQVLVQKRVGVLYRGSIASVLVVITSHYPFFYIYNWLDSTLKKSSKAIDIAMRSAFIGFFASISSDACSNFLRILKTVMQSSLQEEEQQRKLTYATIVQRIYVEGGLQALLGRGLMTRILTNCLHNVFFLVFWKLIPHFLSGESR